MSDEGDDSRHDEDDSLSDSSSLSEVDGEANSESQSGDESDVLVWQRRFEKQKAKWLQATVTIESLIEQFTEYR